ncbi:MAG: AMP-binding protein, partial [Boseongicola sp.]|nr:AMP-binding protein [Boseongicola sp.]
MTAGRSARKALLQRMRAVVDTHAQRTAIHSPGESLSYFDFARLVGRLMGALGNPKRTSSGPVGLLLDRSAMAYAAMWAAIALGRPYVPLNAKYPPRRLRSILRQASIDAVVCTQANRDIAIGLGIAPGNVVVAETDMPDKELHGGGTDWNEGDEDQGIAYILFTSGSTGEPKGVPISYDNLGSFINNLESIIRYRPEDVCSQFCDLSFDMSVHEIYLALLNGCALCPARPIDLFNPARLVVET